MKALLIIAAAIGAPLLAICLRVGQSVVNDGVRAIMIRNRLHFHLRRGDPVARNTR